MGTHYLIYVEVVEFLAALGLCELQCMHLGVPLHIYSSLAQ